MPFTINDVGERPGRAPLSDAEKQEIADRWNANEAAQIAGRANPTVILEDKIDALMEAAGPAVAARAAAIAKEKRGG